MNYVSLAWREQHLPCCRYHGNPGRDTIGQGINKTASIMAVCVLRTESNKEIRKKNGKGI